MENLQQQNINQGINVNKNISSLVNFIPMFFLVISILILFLDWMANGFDFYNVYSSLGILSIWLLIVFILSIISLVSKRKIVYNTINYFCIFGTLIILVIYVLSFLGWRG